MAPEPTAFSGLFHGRSIHWQTFFGSYVAGLDLFLPIRLVSCLDDGSDFDLLREGRALDIVSVEQPANRRVNWIGSGIHPIFENRLHEIEKVLASQPRDSWLLTSSPPCELMEAFCGERGYRYVGTRAAGIEPFKHKARLWEALDDRSLPRLAGRWLRLGGARYSELASEFGAAFVVQSGLGAAGSGTALVRSKDDLAKLDERMLGDEVWAAPCVGEISFNINAAVMGGLAFVGFPNVQLAGWAELGAPWGGYCGNDYTAAAGVDAAIVRDVQDQTNQIGLWLASQGFEGLYGLDFVLNPSDGRAYAVDLNPRWQGSTALSTQAEAAAGRLPLAVALFAYQGGLLGLRDLEGLAGRFSEPILGSQLCLRFRQPQPLAAARVHPGVYSTDSGWRFSRPGYRLSDLRSGEALVTGGLPRAGVTIEPGAWLCRIVSRDAALQTSNWGLTEWARLAAAEIQAATTG